MNPERIQAIDDYKATKNSFTDYVYFEGEISNRQARKKEFLEGKVYNPKYEYSKLDDLRFNDDLQSKKSAIYESVLELEAAKSEVDANIAELEIYAGFQELALKKIMLIESARDLHQAHNSNELEVARTAFKEMNVEVYGEFDEPLYKSMIVSERDKVESFRSMSENASKIKTELLDYFNSMGLNQEQEKPLMSDENLLKLQKVILDRYSTVLETVPETDDSVYYDASQCAEIINNALKAADLAELGWSSEINPDKTNPTVNYAKSCIYLPTNTRRNANELRRLIIHEQEVHIRRRVNGKKTEFKPLINGTANYVDIEEGLGVILECAVAGNWNNASFNRARDRYITMGLAVGIDGVVLPRNARQVHDVLWRMQAIRNSKTGEINEQDIDIAKNTAYTLVENAFRGTEFWMSGDIYTKLKVYYEGLAKNAQFFADNIDDLNKTLDTVMIGKYNHTDTSEINTINEILATRQKDLGTQNE